MDWHLNQATYYADFIIVPLLVLAALWYASLSLPVVLAALLGVVVWTFIEYAMHRWIFHWFYRREHWAHHQRPKKFIGVPPWQTALAFLTVYVGCVGSLGLAWGTGLFTGLMAGYWFYIAAHALIHHGGIAKWDGILGRMARRHDLHHKGYEGNFGVITTAWDKMFKTFRAS